MKLYKVVISQEVYTKLLDIALYIDSFNIYPAGLNYISEIETEIRSLAYRAGSIPDMIWKPPKKQPKSTKRLLVKGGKLAVLFHIYHNYVIVDDIVPSSMLYVN